MSAPTNTPEQRALKLYSRLLAAARFRVGKLISPKESAHDIVQSVFREAIRDLPNADVPTQSRLLAWMNRLLRNKIIDKDKYYRRDKRNVEREASTAFMASGSFDPESGAPSPSQLAMLNDDLQRWDEAMAQLSDEDRDVIEFCHVVSLTRAEVADELGVTEGTVRVRLHRAMANLREILAPSP